MLKLKLRDNMFNKKYILILSLLIVGICAISAASAADNITDAVAVDDTDAGDAIAIDDADEVAANIEENTVEKTAEDENNEISASEEGQVLSKDQSEDVLSTNPVKANQYKIEFTKDVFKISGKDGGDISFDLTVCSKKGYYKYNFYVESYNVADLANPVIKDHFYSTSDSSDTYDYPYNPKEIAPGTYLVVARNVYDNEIMDSTLLAVSGTAVITANNYKGVYTSGTKMTVKVTDKDTGLPLKYAGIKAVFTKGKTTVTKSYRSGANGQFSFVPPVGVGTWTVTFSSDVSWISVAAVKKTVTVTKAPAKVKAFKAREYKGYKMTLKAKVTSKGKNVNEGTVAFKINGKTYKASVKNGIATAKVSLKKVKTYKYTAKFTSSNFKASKAAKAKAILKKSFKTKIISKHYKVYVFEKKNAKVQIKTKEGKKVKGGKLKIIFEGQSMTVKVNKKGVAKIPLKGLSVVDHFVGFTKKGETYKKYITKKIKVKYIPSSHKYRSSSAKVKASSVFKCPGPGCGKTSSHYHMGHDSYGVPYKHFYAVV